MRRRLRSSRRQENGYRAAKLVCWTFKVTEGTICEWSASAHQMQGIGSTDPGNARECCQGMPFYPLLQRGAQGRTVANSSSLLNLLFKQCNRDECGRQRRRNSLAAASLDTLQQAVSSALWLNFDSVSVVRNTHPSPTCKCQRTAASAVHAPADRETRSRRRRSAAAEWLR